MGTQLDVGTLWSRVVDDVKEKVIHPTLWRSLEMAVPITAENGEFIVGFAPANLPMSGHLSTSEHKNAIERALREFTGQTFRLRIIEGITLQDWIEVKQKEKSLQVAKEAAYRKKEAESAVTQSWEALLEMVGRKYAALPLRQLPQFRAQYIEDMLKVISDTMDELMPAGHPADEISERALARVIDKVGTLTETPPALIAVLLHRYRAERRR